MPLSDPSDLGRLNATERDLLALLGRGHTIKSIAHLRGLSEASVNERFRSARRKTGMGSSREVARLILAQENRHEIPELVSERPRPDEPRRPDAPRGVSLARRWKPLMIVATLLASAVLAQQTSVPPGPSIAGQALPPEARALFNPPSPPDLTALHAEVGAGSADPSWTADVERSLTRIYERAAAPAELAMLEVSCNAALCEVLGVADAGMPLNEIPRILESLQGQEVDQASQALGLENVVQSFGASPVDAAGSPFVFAVYWRRVS